MEVRMENLIPLHPLANFEIQNIKMNLDLMEFFQEITYLIK